MFWSGNFMVMRELNFLLKEENVTLALVLEADDILQECKADNKTLIQYLTRPDILEELITLITEEPPKNVELSMQYRHASIACEVLTSHLSTLSDRLTLDIAQMNRLCNFINKDPPLNPLLASYFSKTVEMLLERSPKQDWYLYHIVCLRVLDFFKSRQDFLPNLLRHISTSAISDTFKYLIRLDDLFNKPIMEWLEEHQFIDSLIQIICGTYVPAHLPPAEPEKGQRDSSEKEQSHPHHTGEGSNNAENIIIDNIARLWNQCGAQQEASQSQNSAESPPEDQHPPDELSEEEARMRAERISAVAASNAAALLCDIVVSGCAMEGSSTRSRTASQLAGALAGCACVRSVLCHVFTCAPRHRARALHHAARLLHALLHAHSSENEEERCSVELAVAPHLPLLHQALLHDPQHYAQEEEGVSNAGDSAPGSQRVGAARVSTAALIAQLALSEVEEVATTLITLGTPGVLLDLMFQFPENNFLHGQVVAFCRNALSNRLYRTQYARHLFVECNLLTRLMDAFEENEHKLNNSPRSGYMGHVILLLGCISSVMEDVREQLRLAPALLERWAAFRDQRLCPVLLMHDTPLGGTYPSENVYEVGEELDNISDTLAANYDFSDMAATTNMDELGDDLTSDHEMRNTEHADSAEFIADGLGLDDEAKRTQAHNSFLELASQRFGDDMWDDAPGEDEFSSAPLAAHSADGDVWSVPAWDSGSSELSPGGEGWAQFDVFATAPPDAFATPPDSAPPAAAGNNAFSPFWPGGSDATQSASEELEASMRSLRLERDQACTAELANNLLTAMSAMTADAIANIVNANLQPLPLQPAQVILPAAVTDLTPNPVTPPAEFSNTPLPVPSESSLPFDPPPHFPTTNDIEHRTQDTPTHQIRENCASPSKDTPESVSTTTENVEINRDEYEPQVKGAADVDNVDTLVDNAAEVSQSSDHVTDTGER